MIRKNKRGDVPVMILVLGVFAICALVIISIIEVESDKQKYSSGVLEMDEMNSKIEMYNFYQSIKMPEEKINELLEVKTDSSGKNYISVEKIGFVVKYYI